MTPRIAVVVSAYDRSELLDSLVRGLRSQTVTDFEAVLVDNGSSDDTGARLEALTRDDPRFRVLHVEVNRGPAPARNLAWRATSAPVVAFTDDDCAPDPGWLEELLHAIESADVVQGRTMPAPYAPDARPGWFDRSQQIEGWSDRYETCNIAFRREVLERLDGFDERFRIAMGEDTDLGLRAVASGARTAFAPDALIVHHVFPSGLRAYLHQRRRYSEIVELMRANPAARGLLRGGYVLRSVHLVVLSLLPITAGSIVVGAPWVPVVVVVGWAVRNTIRTRNRPFPLWRRFGNSLLHFVAFAYETWCFAVASVRYRALVI